MRTLCSLLAGAALFISWLGLSASADAAERGAASARSQNRGAMHLLAARDFVTQDWTPPALPPCTCRAQGQVFDMGQEACLTTADGPRMAICAMDQNVTSWKPTTRTCPEASRGRMPAHPAFGFTLPPASHI